MLKFLKAKFREGFPSKRMKDLDFYFKSGGDEKFRFNYNLTPDSIVYDLGGYHGDWASEIYGRFSCNVRVFEPVVDYCKKIDLRFASNAKIHAYNFGLGAKTESQIISILDEGSSMFRSSSDLQSIEILDIKDWFKENVQDLERGIDLIKINIEGAEYELLNRLIELGYVSKFKNIQVQFHDISNDSVEAMKQIQEVFSKTHRLTYSFEFVWENWERID